MPRSAISEQFGQIDIYIFDQLLKGRITPGMRILDARCGAVESVRALARRLAPALPPSNFSVQAVEHMSFDDAWADVVICNTVLHFARDDAHFEAMLHGAWRVLKPGGLFFSRLGSTTGMETQIVSLAGRRYQSPDGSERYLVDDALLRAHTARLGAELAEPLKTTVVHNQRAMTTWVLRKKPAPAPSESF